jgi:Mg2+ and Co2+ transporter CorA
MSANPEEERKFLHDISSPLSTGLFLMDSILNSIRNKLGESAEEVTRLNELQKALMRMRDLVKVRRDLLNPKKSR